MIKNIEIYVKEMRRKINYSSLFCFVFRLDGSRLFPLLVPIRNDKEKKYRGDNRFYKE